VLSVGVCVIRVAHFFTKIKIVLDAYLRARVDLTLPLFPREDQVHIILCAKGSRATPPAPAAAALFLSDYIHTTVLIHLYNMHLTAARSQRKHFLYVHMRLVSLRALMAVIYMHDNNSRAIAAAVADCSGICL